MPSKYTKTLNELLVEDSNLRTEILDIFKEGFIPDENKGAVLMGKFIAQWGMYEVNSLDEIDYISTNGYVKHSTVFVYSIYEIFRSRINYYKQLLDAYEKEYNFEEGLTVTQTSSTTETGTTNGNEKQYDLPRSGGEAKPSNSVSSIADVNNAASTTVTRTDKSKFINLRTQYMNKVRDLFRDFALEFYECFILVY